MLQKNEMNQGALWLPRFQSDIPVSLYINGKQVPPIEAQGEIISFSSACLQIRCENEIPIPSRGIVRFSVDESNDELSMNVDFVQRVKVSQRMWPWSSKTKYEMQAALLNTSGDVLEKFKRFINTLGFGRRNSKMISEEEASKVA